MEPLEKLETFENNTNNTITNKKFYTILALMHLSWIPFALWWFGALIHSLLTTGSLFPEGAGGGLAMMFFPVPIMITFGGIRTHILLYEYKKNKLANRNSLEKLRFLVGLVMIFIVGLAFTGSVINKLINLPGEMAKEKVRQQNTSILDNATTYKDCEGIDNKYLLKKCGLDILAKTNNIKGCVKFSYELKEHESMDAYIPCDYKGGYFTGEDYNDPNLNQRIEDINKAYDEKIAAKIVQDELDKEIAAKQKFIDEHWAEISSQYEVVYSSSYNITIISRQMKCEGYHSFVVDIDGGEIEVFQPCKTYEEFLEKLPAYKNLLFIKELRPKEMFVHLSTEDAMEFAKENEFDCDTYHTVHIDESSRGPVDVYRACDSLSEYWEENLRLVKEGKL